MASQDRARLRATLGKYRIQSLLGRGGMGEVYKAYDPSLDRVVALKTIRTDAADPKLLERFQREGRAAGRLRHPNIVTVFDLGEAEGTVFMAMEYLEGRSLASALKDGSLGLLDRLRVLVHVLDALDHAHRLGVVHRDIKPSNVQVVPDGTVKLLDFGVARVLTAESMSATGTIVGTPYYMAPEQLRGEKVEAAADIYSVGVVGYELLTNRRPFDGQTLTEVVLKVIQEPPAPMDTPWSRAFPELERIVRKAMAKSPAERYTTAGEMADELRAFMAGAGEALQQTGAGTGSGGGAPIVSAPAVTVRSPAADPTQVSAPVEPARRAHGRGRMLWAGVAAVVLLGALGAAAALLGRRAVAVRGGSAVDTGGMRPGSGGRGGSGAEVSPPKGGGGGTVQERGGVCVEAAPGTGEDLVLTVVESLRRIGAPVTEDCAAAALVARASGSVSVRRAPFQAASARTADYVGMLELRLPAESPPRRYHFAGHVLEFSEPVARAGALRQMADRMARRLHEQARRAPGSPTPQ